MRTVLPTESEEQASPTEADIVYRACSTFLRARTREESKFGLLFAENIEYGFRRNIRGLKPLGLPVAVIGLTLSTWKVAISAHGINDFPASAMVVTLLCLGLVAFWLFVVNDRYVTVAADTYAMQLLEACELLAAKPTSPRAKGKEEKHPDEPGE
jgi:hypothetical protein